MCCCKPGPADAAEDCDLSPSGAASTERDTAAATPASASSSGSSCCSVSDAGQRLQAACTLAEQGKLSVQGLSQAIAEYEVVIAEWLCSRVKVFSSGSSSSSKEAQEVFHWNLAQMDQHERMYADALPAKTLLEILKQDAVSLGELQRRCALVQRRAKQLQLQVSHC
jgi:hypothetical protein